MRPTYQSPLSCLVSSRGHHDQGRAACRQPGPAETGRCSFASRGRNGTTVGTLLNDAAGRVGSRLRSPLSP